jgi:hypothetical protein
MSSTEPNIQSRDKQYKAKTIKQEQTYLPKPNSDKQIIVKKKKKTKKTLPIRPTKQTLCL